MDLVNQYFPMLDLRMTLGHRRQPGLANLGQKSGADTQPQTPP